MTTVAKGQRKTSEAAYSRAEIARMLGVTPGTFDRVWKPLIPEAEIRRKGRRVWYRPTAVRAVLDAKVAQAHEEHAGAGPARDLPVIDPLRAIKIEEARIGLLEKTKRLISTDEAIEIFSEVAEHIRLGLATLEEQHGRDATRLMEQQLERAGKALETAIDDAGRD